jgi:L-2,4-diaminobutyric acid acetyltransferase
MKPTLLENGMLLRPPARTDAAAIHELVNQSGGLEANSRYAYLLLCDHFGETGVVAERDDRLEGFVAGYLIPVRPDTVFVWQVGVAESARRTGLGKRLLRALVRRPACREVHHLEATVTPSNQASQRLFRSFARELGAPCREGPGYPASEFGDQAHEDEVLFRVGPFGEIDR